MKNRSPRRRAKYKRKHRQELKRVSKKNKSSQGRFYFQDNNSYRETSIKAPKHLTLKYEYAEPMLRFIKRFKEAGKKYNRIRLLLTDVIYIGEGGVAMLLSVISDLERKGTFCRGMKPTNSDAKDVLERSGFFKHMRANISARNSVSKNDVLTTGNSQTHQREVLPQIHQAMHTVWGEKGRCPVLFGGIGEMLRNSIDHAFKKEKNIVWHLGVSHFESENQVKFSFVDNGDGIINTYTNKNRGVIQKLISVFQSYENVLKEAFEDGIESRTGLPWRGTGLPTIYEMYEDNVIRKLVVITNGCYLDFESNLFVKLNVKFSGTYYYWVVDRQCTPSFYPLIKDEEQKTVE